MHRILLCSSLALGLALPALAEEAAPAPATLTAQADAAADSLAAQAVKPKKVKKEKKAKKPSGKYLAPDFSLKEVATGKTFTLSAQAGKVVLLDFWATWCPPCRAEIPHFIELQKQYGGQGLQIVGVSLDQDGPPVVKPFIQRFGINYPVVVDDGRNAMAYGGIRGIPTTFLLGKNGEKLKTWVGYNDRTVFEAAIKEALAK